MRVMITGATGFVGYHTALSLLDAGHEVSLLVRSVDKMMGLFGNDRIAHYTRGDITEPGRVARALDGCDAVVHAAAMVSTAAGDEERVFRTNTEGTRHVVGGALEKGIGAVIHVSSVTALFDPKAAVLDEHSPPGTARNAYGRSKVASEKYVRKLQAAGDPVYITYPASVIGPDDPGLTEPHIGLQGYLRAFVPVMPTGNQYVDVRDVAQVHRQLLEKRPAFGRYLLGGHYLSWKHLGPELEAATGRRLLKVPLSGRFMRQAGKIFDKVSSRIPAEIPVSEEAMEYATRWVRMDNSKIEQELGFSFRPVQETMGDAVAWLCRAGHISAREAGKAALRMPRPRHS